MREVQLAFDEMYQELTHGHDGVIPTDDGYRARCLCGWISMEKPTKPLARGSASSHIARTVPGARVVALLRK